MVVLNGPAGQSLWNWEKLRQYGIEYYKK